MFPYGDIDKSDMVPKIHIKLRLHVDLPPI